MLIPLVGALNSDIMFFAGASSATATRFRPTESMIAPLVVALMNRYPNIRVTFMWTGIVMGVWCLITASFATQTWHLVVGEGVGMGSGVPFHTIQR